APPCLPPSTTPNNPYKINKLLHPYHNIYHIYHFESQTFKSLTVKILKCIKNENIAIGYSPSSLKYFSKNYIFNEKRHLRPKKKTVKL
ncbi:hypothetical protein Q6325_27915, partial [Klebsiella pneumoniae]|uniref:hypothetical protein n=1 Tax=Klebsiella pneumoniae TaxID=573 RepID=UPI002731B84E